jgi:putative NADH-flavin reductase
MKIAIFGATGRTGMEAVKRALANNHTVTAIVR